METETVLHVIDIVEDRVEVFLKPGDEGGFEWRIFRNGHPAEQSENMGYGLEAQALQAALNVYFG